MLSSLQLRITLIAVAFAVLLAATLTAAGGLVVHQQLVENMSARARLAASELHTQLDRLVQLGLSPENISGFDDQCANILRRDPNLDFAGVFDIYGGQLFGAGERREEWSLDASWPATESQEGSLLAVQSVRTRDGRVAAYVVVAVSSAAITEATWRNVRYFILIALLLILLGLALHQIVLRRMVTQPLRGLMQAVARIDAGDESSVTALPTGGRDDIGRLAQAFNDLLLRLSDTRRALLQQNRKLEATVQERTRQLQELNQALAEDIERRKSLEDELRTLASTDPLTGLANRAFVMPYLERRLEHARHQQRSLAVLLCDLDGFKPVNDAFGHATGDRALQAVANRLRENSRQSDVVARIGGDEFVIVLEAYGDIEQIEAYARKLVALFVLPFDIGGRELRLGLSIGASLFPGDAEDVSGLLAQADHAMYRAKESGLGFCFAAHTEVGRDPLKPA